MLFFCKKAFDEPWSSSVRFSWRSSFASSSASFIPWISRITLNAIRNSAIIPFFTFLLSIISIKIQEEMTIKASKIWTQLFRNFFAENRILRMNSRTKIERTKIKLQTCFNFCWLTCKTGVVQRLVDALPLFRLLIVDFFLAKCRARSAIIVVRLHFFVENYFARYHSAIHQNEKQENSLKLENNSLKSSTFIPESRASTAVCWPVSTFFPSKSCRFSESLKMA